MSFVSLAGLVPLLSVLVSLLLLAVGWTVARHLLSPHPRVWGTVEGVSRLAVLSLLGGGAGALWLHVLRVLCGLHLPLVELGLARVLGVTCPLLFLTACLTSCPLDPHAGAVCRRRRGRRAEAEDGGEEKGDDRAEALLSKKSSSSTSLSSASSSLVSSPPPIVLSVSPSMSSKLTSSATTSASSSPVTSSALRSVTSRTTMPEDAFPGPAGAVTVTRTCPWLPQEDSWSPARAGRGWGRSLRRGVVGYLWGVAAGLSVTWCLRPGVHPCLVSTPLPGIGPSSSSLPPGAGAGGSGHSVKAAVGGEGLDVDPYDMAGLGAASNQLAAVLASQRTGGNVSRQVGAESLGWGSGGWEVRVAGLCVQDVPSHLLSRTLFSLPLLLAALLACCTRYHHDATDGSTWPLDDEKPLLELASPQGEEPPPGAAVDCGVCSQMGGYVWLSMALLVAQFGLVLPLWDYVSWRQEGQLLAPTLVSFLPVYCALGFVFSDTLRQHRPRLEQAESPPSSA